MSDYGDVHRKHMQVELEHQDKEWRRLNVADPSNGKTAFCWAGFIGLTLGVMAGLLWFTR